MIPNWLLGKSKSKLQEILGGGGGGGTTYTAGTGIDITNHEISVDPLLMVDIEQTALAIPTKAAKTQISNPNILHNPWFTVNQREATSVTANGLFIADRWYCYSPVAFTISRDSNGHIVINNTSIANYSAIIQKRTTTYINSLNGMKLTASIMLSDGTIKSGTITFDSTGATQKYYEDEDMVAYVLPSANQLFGLNVKAGKSVTIKALKLEVGEISTLHLDPRPEYATELAKCQRYFQRIGHMKYEIIGGGMVKEATIATCGIIVPPLRKDLSTSDDVRLHGSVYIWNNTHLSGAGDLSTELDSFTIAKDGHGSINFKSNGLTVSSVAMFQFRDTTSYIDLDAEL